MSDDPKRWREGGGGDEALERALLASVRDVRPPAHAKEQAWQGIAVQLAAGAAAAGVAGSSSAASGASSSAATGAASSSVAPGAALATSTLAAKAVWTLVVTGIAAGGYFAVREGAPSSPTHEARGGAAEVVRPTVATPEPVARPSEQPMQAADAEPVQAAAHRVDAKRRDPLSAESAALTRARAALRAGDLAAAEKLLQRMATEFKSGALAQEREVLAIEVLAARGDAAGARARVRGFERAYPDSPHAARLHTLLGAP